MTGHSFSPVCAATSLFLAGVGQGTISIPSISAAYSSIGNARLPVANTALNIAQRIGGPVATTLVSMVVAWTVPRAAGALPGQFLPAFIMLAALHLPCVVAAAMLPRRIRQADQG
jgi:hypothetical protein